MTSTWTAKSPKRISADSKSMKMIVGPVGASYTEDPFDQILSKFSVFILLGVGN